MENQPKITLEQFDVATVYRVERDRWLKTEAPAKSLAEYFGMAIPYFIVIVALGAFALSAPHTASVLNSLTPGWGWVGPIIVEFTIIFIAFRRKQLELQGLTLSHLMVVLRGLAFVTAIVTNFTGALVAVVASAGLDKQSGGDILYGFATLPITNQASLFMVVIMAIVVPIIAEVAGHEVADLIYMKQRYSVQDHQWKQVEQVIVYRAVFTELQQTGMSVSQAKDTAKQLVGGYFGKTVKSSVSLLSQSETKPETRETGVSRETNRTERALFLLAEHPDYLDKPTRELESLTGISKATWSRAKKRLQ
jgi:hypothetical protein